MLFVALLVCSLAQFLFPVIHSLLLDFSHPCVVTLIGMCVCVFKPCVPSVQGLRSTALQYVADYNMPFLIRCVIVCWCG